MWSLQRWKTGMYSRSTTTTTTTKLIAILQVPPVFIATLPNHDLPGFKCKVSVPKLQLILTSLTYVGKFRHRMNRFWEKRKDWKRQVKVLARVGILCAHLSMHVYTIIWCWILQGVIYTCECRSALHSKYEHGSYILRIPRSKEPTVGQAQWSSFVRQTHQHSRIHV